MKLKIANAILLLICCAAIRCMAEGPAASPTPDVTKPQKPDVNPELNKLPSNVESIEDVVIGKGGERTLHARIIRSKNPPKHPMPAILFIHGGGWAGGSYKGNIAHRAAEQGYFLAGIEYRLSGEAKWPAQLEDCKLGVRWMRANAAKYNVDPNRIVCWGHSAGGHLVACMGTMNDPKYEGTGGYPGVSSRVQAVVDLSGPVDLASGTFSPDGETSVRAKNGMRAMEVLFGTTYAEKPQLWAEASPINHISADAPPFIIGHGTKDPGVSVTQATNFAAALKKAGVPVDLILVENGSHSILGMSKATPAPDPDAPTLLSKILEALDKDLKKPKIPDSAK